MRQIGKIGHSRPVKSLSALLGVVILIFLLFQLLGDPSKMLVGQTTNKSSMELIKQELHLDQPAWKRLIFYLNDLSPISVYEKETLMKKEIKGIEFGDNLRLVLKWPYLGRSYQSKQWVGEMLFQALWATFLLAFFSMLFASLVGIPLGIISAVRKGRIADNLIQVAGVIGTSAPSFFIGLMVAYLGGMVFHEYTGLDFNGSLYTVDPSSGEQILTLKNIILPSLALGLRPMAMILQMTRSAMLDVLNRDYIRTAMAKGLGSRQILYMHAFRNALNPVLTGMTGWTAELLAGAFFIEFIFGWQGLGKLTVESLEKLDWPVLNGAILWNAIIFIFTQTLTDWLQRKLDPRIKG